MISAYVSFGNNHTLIWIAIALAAIGPIPSLINSTRQLFIVYSIAAIGCFLLGGAVGVYYYGDEVIDVIYIRSSSPLPTSLICISYGVVLSELIAFQFRFVVSGKKETELNSEFELEYEREMDAIDKKYSRVVWQLLLATGLICAVTLVILEIIY